MTSHHVSSSFSVGNAPMVATHVNSYPTTLIDTRQLRTGRHGAMRLTLRPVFPQDAPLLAQLLTQLSPQARRQRFHGAMKPSMSLAQRMSCPDFHRELALVVTVSDGAHERALVDARYVVHADGEVAEFGLVVAEDWQRRGLGLWALQALERAASAAGLQWLQGEVLTQNEPMLALAAHAGYALSPREGDADVQLALRALEPPGGRGATSDWHAPVPARLPGVLGRWLRALRPAHGLLH